MCENNAANEVVDLTLYSKGWVEPSHRDSITSKASHLKQLYLLKNAYHYYLLPRTGVAEMVGAVVDFVFTMNQFPFHHRLDAIKLALAGTQDWWCRFPPLLGC